jgi:sn-glycerol 3-phosphate transport system substrate-binding protein
MGRKFALVSVFILLIGVMLIASPIKITLWYSGTGIYSQVLLNAVKEFNSLHKGEVEVVAVYTGSYQNTMQKLLSAMVGGQTPTLAQIEQSRVGQFIEGGAIQDLENYAKKDPEFIKDFFPALVEACRYNGKLYALPLNNSSPLLYYNKDLFRQAGLDPNKPPKTWSEVYEDAKKISALGKDIYGLRIGNDDWLIEAYIWQFGGRIISDDGRKMLIDNPGAVEAWKFFQKMIREKIAVYTSVGKAGNTLDLSGKIGMVVRSTGSLAYLKKNVKWDLGATFMPYEKQKVVPIGGGNLYMFASATPKQKEAAWEFMKFLDSPKVTLQWGTETGYMCARVSAFNSEKMQEFLKENPLAKLTYTQLQWARRRPWYGPYREVFNVMLNGWEKMLTNTSSNPADVLKEVQQKAQEILDNYY